ncbi:hypothetical protein Tco_0679066 [Tanacetum coccineum]|uniref:Uncharacterized protein n=1 Tax=Tanacetum coccineum TaxID=301880 RepID=A0ABQ4XGY0_9ASTR
MVLEKKVNTKPIDYVELNQLYEDFGKRFVPILVLAYMTMINYGNSVMSSRKSEFPTPRKLPKVSLVNTSLKKLKYHIGQFDNVVKKRITPDALTEGEWGFEHTKAVFIKEIIPFVKTLKDIFNVFDKDLLNEKQFLIENDRLLDQIISQDIMNIVVNSSIDVNTSVNVNSFVAMIDSVNYVEMCNKCLELEAELIKQHNMNNTSVNQTKPSFDQLFELNNLKAELQADDTTIEKLKANIKHLNKTSTTNSVKKDIDEIETINIELEHRENVFVITTLKNDLRKIKGKDIVDNTVKVSNATTIAPGMYKLDPVTLAPKDMNNRETHIYYLKYTMEQACILREIVEQAKSLNPLDSASYSACKYVKLIQELLGYVRDTCPDIHKPSEKLVAVTPINKKKTVSSMFDARHELCFLEFVSDMNASSKSKEPIPLEVIAQESVVTKVYTRRPKVPKTNGSNSKPKTAKSMISNKTKPDTSWGSNTSVSLSSSSSVDLRLSKLFCSIWTPDAPST